MPRPDLTMLDSLAERAQRQLDGMGINRDAFSRDVLRLVGQLRQQQAAEQTWQQSEGDESKSRGSGYTEAFGDIFDDIFKRTGR